MVVVRDYLNEPEGYSHVKDVQAVQFRLVWWATDYPVHPRGVIPHCREVIFNALVVGKSRGYEVHNITAQERFPQMRTTGIRQFMASLGKALENTLGAPIVGLSPYVVDWEMMEGVKVDGC